ncbi:MAG: acyltransferase [Bacteroidales bacterium]|jgi:acetyltransferase-like isoleucine patch superfamily enzyme|nr:acyltransferase [Bacteroidales bacterium]
MNYWFLLAFLLCFFDRIIILLSLIPIRIWNSRLRKVGVLVNRKDSEVNSEPVKNHGINKRLKRNIARYISGYIRYVIIKTGNIPSHHLRKIIYTQVFLINLKKDVVIYSGAEFRSPFNLKIGKGSIIGDNVILDARNGIEIGDNVNFSSNISIWTEQHDHRDKYFRCNSDESFGVKINNRVWIGPNVTILHGVTIGEGAVVAAGSVVTKNIEPFAIYGGMPAKNIGKRNNDLRYEFKGTYLPFY